jgi:hypothetical protein
MVRRMAKHPTMTARQIIDLLAVKHSEDCFVPECKDGGSTSRSHKRLDAWAMRKSWSNPCVTGYELKVSRSDFLGDDKWHAYLPMCNDLYFVTPAKMVQPDEVPAPAGLMWATENRVYLKKKPVRRDGPISENVFRYILMWRASIDGRGPRVENWKAWVEQKQEDMMIGHAASKSIRDTVRQHVISVRDENCRLRKENAEYESIKKLLAELGFVGTIGVSRWRVEERLKHFNSLFSPELVSPIRQASIAMSNVEKYIEKESAKLHPADAA